MTASARAPSRCSAPRSGITYDTTDDLLDPLRGTRLSFGTTPYISVADSDVDFAVMRLSDSFYVPLEKEHHVVLASWARIGTILGADSTAELPATKRLYGGGAGSVRAYGYQELRPDRRLTATRPADGRSSSSVPSCAGACSGTSAAPCSSRAATSTTIRCPISIRIRWGAGVGLRYFTEFGPVRLDVAFPINPRRSDDVFQVYIGIGQAF